MNNNKNMLIFVDGVNDAYMNSADNFRGCSMSSDDSLDVYFKAAAIGSDGDTVTVGSNVYYIAGTYTAIVSDANGCEISVEYTISEPELLEASVSVTDALCNGGSGSAELTINGGTAPYDMEDLSSLSAGDYTTTVVDAILTKKGRERLAEGRANFNITQFALADDEIDYSLYS